MDSWKTNELQLEQLMPLIREQLDLGKQVILSPNGKSMLPMLRPGRDSVVLSPITGELKKYDIPLYQRDSGQYVLHRIVKAAESYTLVGDGQLCVEKGVRRDQIIAVVTSFIRNGKKHSVNDFWYGAYCRLWHWTRPLRRLLYGVIRLFRRKK